MKQIDPNKQLPGDIIGDSSDISGDEPSHAKQTEMLNAPSNPKSKRKKKNKKKIKGIGSRSSLPENRRNDNVLDVDVISHITSDEKDDKVHDEFKIMDDGRDSIFELEPQEEDVYVGYKKIEMAFEIPITLIKCNELQLHNVKVLLSLDHINILKIEDITNVNIGGESSTFFVLKSVQRVDHYYNSLLETFRSEYIVEDDDTEKVLSRWWKFIGPQFRTIFRAIVDGLIFFVLRGYFCSYDSFVTPMALEKYYHQ